MFERTVWIRALVRPIDDYFDPRSTVTLPLMLVGGRQFEGVVADRQLAAAEREANIVSADPERATVHAQEPPAIEDERKSQVVQERTVEAQRVLDEVDTRLWETLWHLFPEPSSENAEAMQAAMRTAFTVRRLLRGEEINDG